MFLTAGGEKIATIKIRGGEIEIRTTGDDLRELRASVFAKRPVMFADTHEELGRRDVVIPDDLAAARALQSFDTNVPADRVVIDQNVVRIVQISNRGAGGFDMRALEV